MKKTIFIFALMIPLMAFSQQKSVLFTLQSDGSYSTGNANQYELVTFEGVTAAQLYSMVITNAYTLFDYQNGAIKDCVENKSISLKPLIWNIVYSKGLIGFLDGTAYDGYLNLYIQFKDGKIRVDIPSIDDELWEKRSVVTNDYNGHITGVTNRKEEQKNGLRYSFLTSQFFDKSGNLKPKQEKYYKATQERVNNIINTLLGMTRESKQKADFNW